MHPAATACDYHPYLHHQNDPALPDDNVAGLVAGFVVAFAWLKAEEEAGSARDAQAQEDSDDTSETQFPLSAEQVAAGVIHSGEKEVHSACLLIHALISNRRFTQRQAPSVACS